MALEDNFSLVRQLEQKLTDVVVLDISEFETELKAIGPKIGSSGKPGIGKDGDGDGLCNESFGVGVPCPPDVPDVPLWSANQKMRLQKRRDAIGRFKERKRTKANFSVKDLFDAKKSGKDKEVNEKIAQIFAHDGLGEGGRFKSRVTDIGYSGLENGAPNYFNITGQFYDENDNLVGSFSRSIDENGTISHHTLFMDDGSGEMEAFEGKADYRGKGIGSDFLLESQEKYGDIGGSQISVIAVSQGAYNWAVDGYDWADNSQRKKFLQQMQRVLDDTKNNWFETKEERELFQRLLEKALNEDFDDKNRVTPYLFTLFPKSKQFMTAQLKNPDEFMPTRLNWAGKKPVAALPKSLLSLLEDADVKAIGPKIGSSGKPGIGKDGDGDGLCNESFGVGVPCPPSVPDVPLWSAKQKARLEKRRSTVQRFKEKKRIKANFKISNLFKAVKDRDEEAQERYIRRIFDHDNLGENGNFKSRVTNYQYSDFDGSFLVDGEFLDENDNVVGKFERAINRNGKVDHINLFIDDGTETGIFPSRGDYRGQGIGSDFILETQDKYADIEAKQIDIIAANDGVYNWAVDGYDWEDEGARDNFLKQMRRALTDNQKEWFPNDEERQLFEQLLEKAEGEQWIDPNRVTPYLFTLFTNSREFMTVPLSGQSESYTQMTEWAGKKPVSALPEPKTSVMDSLRKLMGEGTESIWGPIQKKRLEKRREVIARRKERGKEQWTLDRPPTIKMLRDSAMMNSPKTVEVYAAPIFEFDNLGEKGIASTKIGKVVLWGTKPEENDAGIPPSVYVTGDYLNKSGKQIGTFSYTLRLDPVDGKMVVEHEHISISKKHRGTGIGSDHQLLVEEQLARMGFEESRLLATMEDGAYNWAVDGYDWENQTQKAKFLTHMQQILDDTKNDWFETKEERELFAKLIADAQKQKSASPKRITPYHFTLFPRAKEFMTKPLNWYGTRPIRKSPDK